MDLRRGRVDPAPRRHVARARGAPGHGGGNEARVFARHVRMPAGRRTSARCSAAAGRIVIVYLGAMVFGTNGRAASLLLALAWTPACASGAGFGDEATGATSGSESSGSGEAATAMTATTEVDPTSEPETSTSTTETPTSTGEQTTGDTSSGGEETTTSEDLPHPELYPDDRTQSPITQFVADNMRAIAAAPAGADKDPHVFAKIGGSTTASVNYMQCFALDATIQDLPAEPTLQSTIEHFRMTDLGGVTAFNRVSLAAMPGWSSEELYTGMPSPVEAEVTEIKPRFASLLIGTHDLDLEQPAQLWPFSDHVLDIVDSLLAAGVIPIVSTIPQRTDLPAKNLFVPRYNAVLRAAAQGRQIPLVDLDLALSGLPMAGLTATGDLSVYASAMVDRPCHFNELALMSGYNVRNLEDLRALDRARQVVVEETPELDPPGPRLQGSGTMAKPFVIPSLPFVDLRSTADSTSDVIDAYGGVCDDSKDESGPEVFYKLEVPDQINVRIMVFDRGAVDVDVHVLSDLAAEKCLKRNDREVAGPLPPGTYYIAVDSFAGDVPGGAVGEYSLVVMAD